MEQSFYMTLKLSWYGPTSHSTVKSLKPSSKHGNKTRMPTLTTSIAHSTENPSHSNQTGKRNKAGGEEIKTVSICRRHDTL